MAPLVEQWLALSGTEEVMDNIGRFSQDHIAEPVGKAGEAIGKGFGELGQGINEATAPIGNAINEATAPIGNAINEATAPIGKGIEGVGKGIAAGAWARRATRRGGGSGGGAFSLEWESRHDVAFGAGGITPRRSGASRLATAVRCDPR